jgi:transcriptional regulator of nitric oxide reductase
MENGQAEQAYCVKDESVEGLLLMAVLGQDSLREAALRELGRRKAIRDNIDFVELYMTNLSVAAN